MHLLVGVRLEFTVHLVLSFLWSVGFLHHYHMAISKHVFPGSWANLYYWEWGGSSLGIQIFCLLNLDSQAQDHLSGKTTCPVVLE